MKYIRKALLAGGFTLVGTAGGLMADGEFTWQEAVIALGAGLVAARATWRVPNADAPGTGN